MNLYPTFEEFKQGLDLSEWSDEEELQEEYKDHIINDVTGDLMENDPHTRIIPCLGCNTKIDNYYYCDTTAFQRKLRHKFESLSKPDWYGYFMNEVYAPLFNFCDTCMDDFETKVFTRTDKKCPECDKNLNIIHFYNRDVLCNECRKDIEPPHIRCFTSERSMCDYDLCKECFDSM